MVLVILYLFIILVTAGFGLLSFRIAEAAIRVLTILLFITFLSESISVYLPMAGSSNYPVYHFYVIISFWLYSLIYFYLFKAKNIRFVVLGVPVVFTIFCIVNSMNYQRLNQFPSTNVMVSNITLVIYSLIYLKHLIDSNLFISLRRNAEFWLNSAVLVYFTLQVFIWGIFNYLIKNKMNINPMINFAVCTSIIFYLVLGLAIYLETKKLRKAVQS
ncbi:MAG TPA: hypothetical protein VK645_04695 [Chitinophagaceae bacterium]|nr:hypothetical protein [Chitinophagaceae bacterium]